MNKYQFISQLKAGLMDLPQKEVEERLSFYEEMIDDRVEEGLSEEDAVLQIGSADKIISQIKSDIPYVEVVKKKAVLKRELKAWEIILLALASPIWVSLLIAAFAVIISLYVSVWSVIIVLWAAFGSLIGASVCGLISGVVIICSGKILNGIAMIGASTVCAGLSVFTFFGVNALTKLTVLITKKAFLKIKNIFIKEEEA